jgi:hypothetical protein
MGGFEGLRLYVSAMLITWGTISVGGCFALAAWTMTGDESGDACPRKIPMSLLAFTASVSTDLVGFAIVVALHLMKDSFLYGVSLEQPVWQTALVLSFMLLLVGMVLLRRDASSAVRRVVKIGSIVVLIVNLLGLVLYLLPDAD